MDIKDVFDKEFQQKKAAADASLAEAAKRQELAGMRMAELCGKLETLRDSRLPGLSWTEIGHFHVKISLEHLRELTVSLVGVGDELSISEIEWDLPEEKRIVSSKAISVATVAEAAQWIAARIAEDVARNPQNNRFTRNRNRSGQGCSVIIALILLAFVAAASAGALSAWQITCGGSTAGRLSTPVNARGLRASWSKAEVACERSPSRKLPKQRAAQPGASSGRLAPFQAIIICGRNHFEEHL